MNIESRVKQIISERIDIPAGTTIHHNSRFAEDLGADSDAVAEALLAIEEAFNVAIVPEDASSLQSVRDVVNYVERNRGAR